MPDPSESMAAEKAGAIEAELQASIDDAKADVASEAASDEEKRLANERLDRLERELAEVRSGSASAQPTPVETPAPAPAADPNAERFAAIERRLDEMAAKPKEAAEAVGDAAGAVVDTVKDAAEETAEVVESVPKRTHLLFKPLFGRHD